MSELVSRLTVLIARRARSYNNADALADNTTSNKEHEIIAFGPSLVLGAPLCPSWANYGYLIARSSRSVKFLKFSSSSAGALSDPTSNRFSGLARPSKVSPSLKF